MGADILGELEQTARRHIPSKNPFKHAETGEVHFIGGVNGIFSGDF